VASSENIVSELVCDINTEIYPLEMGDKFTLLLTKSITSENSSQEKASWKGDFKSLADEYDYVMYGKVYKYDDSSQGKV
jgi:DNA-directed RNA polymerases I, II, and III subunit RPABC3